MYQEFVFSFDYQLVICHAAKTLFGLRLVLCLK